MDLIQTASKYLATAVIAFTAGLAGSAVQGWLAAGNPGVVRAERFEVVGARGSILSYWGPDADPQLPSSTPRGTLLVFADQTGTGRLVVGSRSGDLGPELNLNDRRGQGRFELALGDGDDPMMAFRNAATWRIQLGAIHGDVADRKINGRLGPPLSYRKRRDSDNGNACRESEKGSGLRSR